MPLVNEGKPINAKGDPFKVAIGFFWNLAQYSSVASHPTTA
jgi:hypothetical protein